jgi:hypothetical protein
MKTLRNVFTHTDPSLLPVLEELKRREPTRKLNRAGLSPIVPSLRVEILTSAIC